MAYDVRRWPDSVYPGEVDRECPEAREVIDVLIRNLRRQGPSPDGYQVKTLGARTGGLWQINLKVERRQIRVLYAPYGEEIVLFRIHKKSSSQEQLRAYDLAKTRKRVYERNKRIEEAGRNTDGRNRTVH
jgi:hypothetical protein